MLFVIRCKQTCIVPIQGLNHGNRNWFERPVSFVKEGFVVVVEWMALKNTLGRDLTVENRFCK